ncbi:uncharacterized protein [Linepithema humile]|uniref:uncharacterized protein isoform X1 n=2 Tax=Linepithema humile TaxID=83485 RepID=UPI00351DB400
MSRRGRKRKVEKEEPKVNDGDQDNFFPDETRAEMETMWEIPQISHFLHLARESLSIPQLSIYEMERMLSMPGASKQLANIMTCLLSSPITKAKLRKIPPMPYEFWTNILAHKMNSWFKVYHAKHKDATKVLETIGVESEFWNLFPDVLCLNGKDFEDLTFKQRVWLLKTVCDTIMHTRKTVQEDIAKQPWEDQFETVLGVDRYGARYIYFPQFMPNDLRIYRHSLDNKILSTVKSVKSNQETETIKLINARLTRYKQKKLQSCNNSSERRSSRRNCKIEDKDLNSYKCNNDSTASSFISEDTNLSSTSTYSNNNNISLDTLKRKRSRSLSKTSEESTLSNARSSSGYDTNTSGDNKSICTSPQMFKGFTNAQNDHSKIELINEILDDLKSEINEEKNTNEYKSNNNRESQENFIESYKTGSCNETLVAERSENEKLGDNLSSSSKTDDEKLNEIISAESCKLSEDLYLKNVCNNDNVSDISTSTSKSDDEKLSETKTSDISMNKDSLTEVVTPHKSYRASSSDSEKIAERKDSREASTSPIESESKHLVPERNLRKRTRLRTRHRTAQHNEESKPEAEEDNKTSEADKKNLSASEMRLQEDVEDNLDDDTNSLDYNSQGTKDPKTEEHKRHFNKMLSDLSVSEFQLVVDSVGGLRDLIASFENSKNNNANSAEVYPPCEVKLVEKLTELLKSLEPVEMTLKDSTRKAKAKLQREWSNFKEGSVEDQDSSGEGGLSSNWWVLGSQGRDSLSTTGDATLQALPQPALSPFGAQNTQQQAQPVNSEHESASKNCSEQSHNASEETSDKRQDRNEEKQPDVGAPSGRNQVEDRREKREGEANEGMSSGKDEGQQTRRVLRARGISSYTEQLYSDCETEEDELEEWTDVEAVYAAPGAQADTSASHATPKDRHADDWSDEEDSDQDWILPGSRKRKNKRPSANRRLKSFQHKLHNITENTNDAGSSVPQPDNVKIVKDKFKVKLQDSKEVGKAQRIDSAQVSGNVVAPATSKKNSKAVVSSTSAICKIESVSSVHSELDIKDEGPIYESNPANNYVQSNYNSPNPQQNYYYVISPQNPGIAGGSIIPQGSAPLMQTVQGVAPLPIQQSYYVQPSVQQNYVIQSPTFLPAPQQQQQQQPIFQQQGGLQIVSTDVRTTYVNNNGYVPYMAHNPQNMGHPRAQNRYNQNINPPRPILPYPNGAVIRSSSAPIRGGRQRFINPQPARGIAPQQRMPTSRATARQKAAQMSSAESSGQKTTSLIVISDSDDEIEMIITEKSPAPAQKAKETSRVRSAPDEDQSRQKPTITSDITVTSGKTVIPPQIIQRMNQGGISITPVKNTPPPQSANSNTQLVVVVNETGSHYALALPNGSKLILTPEQVAQIRASNGGKLIL